jgi:hypothetical protein
MRRRSHTELVEEISRNLRPAPHIQRLADTIVARLTAEGPYNGLHLRAEEDAHFWDQYKSREVSCVEGHAQVVRRWSRHMLMSGETEDKRINIHVWHYFRLSDRLLPLQSISTESICD